MPSWVVPDSPIDKDDINNGNEFQNGAGVHADDLNNTVKAALYAQEIAKQASEDVEGMADEVSDLDDRVTELEEGGGGSTITVDDSLSSTSENPVQNKVIKQALDGKQDALGTPVLTFTVKASYIDRNVVLGRLTGLTYVDWGDGTVNNSTSHQYSVSSSDTFIIKVYGVTAISSGTYACISSSLLTEVIIESPITSISQQAFYQCNKLTKVTIGNTVTSIGTMAFSDCTALKSITFSDTVTSIGSSAFQRCTGLKKITIPSTITSIAAAFAYGCYSLQRVIFEGTTPPTLGNQCFDSTNNCPIYVPLSALATYKATTNYTTYASRIVANATTKYVDDRIASVDPIPKWGIYLNQWVTDNGIVFDLGVSIESMNWMCQCRFCGAKIYHSETVSGHPAITCPTCGQSSYLTEYGYTAGSGGGSSKHYWRDENNSVWVDYDDETPQQSPIIIDGICPVCQQNGDTTLFDYDTAWFDDDCPVCNTHLMFAAVDGTEPNIWQT